MYPNAALSRWLRNALVDIGQRSILLQKMSRACQGRGMSTDWTDQGHILATVQPKNRLHSVWSLQTLTAFRKVQDPVQVVLNTVQRRSMF